MKTVNIRVGVVVDSNGNWNATGWSSENLDTNDRQMQEREFLSNAAEFMEQGFPIVKELILTAVVELPDRAVEEIEAQIISPENKEANSD